MDCSMHQTSYDPLIYTWSFSNNLRLDVAFHHLTEILGNTTCGNINSYHEQVKCSHVWSLREKSPNVI